MGTLTRAMSVNPFSTDELRVKERSENFPVALRVLPRRYREALRAVYDVVRVIDDLGDEAVGDRLAKLDELEHDLSVAWREGTPTQAPVRRLVPFIEAHGLSEQPFRDLIQANRMDQSVSTYATLDDLLNYCSLSAAPIGRIVLEVFGASEPANVELSDRVCKALQLVEHWQDVAEDHRMGRIYLPQEDLVRFEVLPVDLEGPPTSAPLRRLICFETDRAGDLLESGRPLVSRLHGWVRIAVSGYVAGGRAALGALRRADGDVMAGPPRPRRVDLLRHFAVVLWEARR